MIFITGDTHSDFTRLSKENFPEQNEMTKDDYVIICGDFGGVWNKDDENKREKWWLDWLNDKPYTTLFVCGNHENFDRLYNYPIEEWNGGKVHKIRPNVIHLMRGQIFELERKSFFTFGGASSHDISAGILELDDPDFNAKKRKLNKDPFALYRINHLSWWKEELPSQEEMNEGWDNLNIYNYNVDYVITHSPFTSLLKHLDGGSGLYEKDYLTDYLQQIKQMINYKCWFFGHMHINKNFYFDRAIGIYEQIIRIL